MSGLQKAIDLAGTQVALAEKLTEFLNADPPIRQPHIAGWLKNGVPARRAIQIEAALDGRVTREELCPEIFKAPRPGDQAVA